MTRCRKLTLATLTLITFALCSCNKATSNTNAPNAPVAQAPSTPKQQTETERELEARIKTIVDRAQGSMAVAITHIETGQTVGMNAKAALPLYSVFKLPLAVAVLKEVEANHLKVDQLVHVTPEEIVP